MRVFLKNNGATCATFNFSPHPDWWHATAVEIIDSAIVPPSWKYLDILPTQEQKDAFLRNWLKQRMIPDYRVNLDAYVRNVLHLCHLSFGRMYGYQGILSSLACFASMFDLFTVEPAEDEYLYFGAEEERMPFVYHLPYDNHSWVHALRETPLADNLVLSTSIPKASTHRAIAGIYPTFSTSVHSAFPSWCEKRGGRFFLVQEVTMPASQKPYMDTFIKQMGNWAFHPATREQNNQIEYDISEQYANGAIIWLQELIPYISVDICSDLWGAIFAYCVELYGTDKPARMIHAIQLAAKNAGRELSLNECGILSYGSEVQPIVIF